MAAQAISGNLVARLSALGTPEAVALVQRFESGQLTEQQFIASASRFLQMTRADHGGALNRAAALHAPRGGFSVPDHTYASIFGKTDRGERVTATEQAILRGDINPTEVLNA